MEGNILKMRAEIGPTVIYYLPIGNQEVLMNELINQSVEIRYLGQINCIRCGKKTSKSFGQGYCYPCFQSAPETEECVLRPELCRAHTGIARDMNFAANHCLIDHFVYLSYTNETKVGVTRHTQIPTRWIDQGAMEAIKIACTPNRYTAGLIEVALKSYYTDKTNWRKMLLERAVSVDLIAEKAKAISHLPEELYKYAIGDKTVSHINYPVSKIAENIKSIDLEKNKQIADIMVGIKGQYLIFKSGYVINIRKYGGYLIRLTFQTLNN
jgi:hypothetical protein